MKHKKLLEHSSFDERLKKVEDSFHKPFQEKNSLSPMIGRAASDMISCLLVGCFLGWGMEKFFSLNPWGIIIGFLLGTLAGIVTIYRSLVKYADFRR